MREWSRRRRALVALVLFACASGYAVQGVGFNQDAHYALVEALSHGTPVIDRYRGSTVDVSRFHGHYYSNKAPGLAFADLPVYEVLRAARVPSRPASLEPTRTDIAVVWLLGLWSALLPALALLVLVARVADDLEPGYGVAAAAALGGATMLLPFSELLFAHSLSAFLGFASFALLWRRRAAVLAGLVAGLAVCVEYPLAVAAGLLCLYAGARGLGRALQFAAGVVLGLVPLALYDWWAFGSPTHLSYRDAVLHANHVGFFGVVAPKPSRIGEILFSNVGLLVITPVVALGAAGLVLLWRRGARLEAALFAAITLGFVVYDAGFVTPIGGETPGPRYLVPMLPFLAVPLAVAWRAWPLATALLAGGSAVYMALLTSTGAVRAADGLWTHHFLHGEFTATLGSYAGLPRAVAIVPWFVLLAAAGWFALDRIPGRLLIASPFALGAWLAVALAAPRIFTSSELGNQHPGLTPLVVAGLAATLVASRRASRAL